MKTAKEILKEKYDKVGAYYMCDLDILEAMEEYAEQFKISSNDNFDWGYLLMFVPFFGAHAIPQKMLNSTNPLVMLVTFLIFLYCLATCAIAIILPFAL